MIETLLPCRSGSYVHFDTICGSPRREGGKGRGLGGKNEDGDGDYEDDRSTMNCRILACKTEDTREERSHTR